MSLLARLFNHRVLIIAVLILGSGCDADRSELVLASVPQEIREVLEMPERAFKELEWEQLVPADDWDALQNPPSYLDEIAEGGLEDQIGGPLESTPASGSGRYGQALRSSKVIDELDGSPSKIPGFIVPIEFSEDNKLMEFFLVPYFGACFHMPPPPPNQIIHVSSALGITIESIYDPVWILGRLNTSLKSNHIATAAYSMDLHSHQSYDYW